MVSWGVKSIWEYYATWFHFDSTTELYPVPARDVYAEVAQLADADALIGKAGEHLAADEPVKALHMLEIALAGESHNQQVLQLRLQALQLLLQRALDGTSNNYEKDYLGRRIALTEDAIAL